MTPLLHLLRRPLLHAAGLSLVVNLLLLVPSIFMLQVFDRVLTSRSAETLLALLGGAALALALLFALDHLRARLQGVAGLIIGDALSPAVARLAVAEGARRQGRVQTDGLRDVMALRSLFTAQGLLGLFDAPWAVIYLGVIWLAHPWLGMTATAAALGMFALAVLNDRLTRKDLEQLQASAASASRYLESSLAHAEVLHTLGMTEAVIARWRQQVGRVAALQGPAAARTTAMAAFTRTFRQAVQVVMMAVGAWLVLSAQASPGVMIACTILLGRALAPVEQVVGSWKVLAEGRAAWARLREALNLAAQSPVRMSLPPPKGELVAQQVVYRAPGSERLLLAGVSLQLDSGQSLAIVGPSGAGKSTLLRLLTGLWTPSAGSVRLDGAELSQWSRDDLAPWLGYVPQDVELFAGTVAENIARLQQVDGAAVVRAAQRAGVHELILSLPQGYDTPIEPLGAVLSPGQRQRIALARALYGEPRLLVLDEPNSNLDGAGELALATALKALRGQVTVVVVTHRQGLVQHMDKLMVLEAGKVTHFGPTAQVLQLLQPARRTAPAADAPVGAGAQASGERGSAVAVQPAHRGRTEVVS